MRETFILGGTDFMGFHGISWNDPTMQTGGCPARFLAERTVSTEHLQKVARSASHRISGSHLETFSDHTFFLVQTYPNLSKTAKMANLLR